MSPMSLVQRGPRARIHRIRRQRGSLERPSAVQLSVLCLSPLNRLGEKTGIHTLICGVSPLRAAVKKLLQPGTDFSRLGTFGGSVAYTGV
jgi:hypothetical protein